MDYAICNLHTKSLGSIYGDLDKHKTKWNTFQILPTLKGSQETLDVLQKKTTLLLLPKASLKIRLTKDFRGFYLALKMYTVQLSIGNLLLSTEMRSIIK